MTTSDYIETALRRQRQAELDLRNERRRVLLERYAARPPARVERTRRGLAYVVRHRLSQLFTDIPAPG